jgi:heme/copper-type cytochrome/quinol oxidase subunit 1
VFDIVYPVTSYEHHEAFTLAMRYGGLAVVPLMIVVLLAWRRRQPLQEGQQPLRAALYSSLLLFTVGGVLGFLIEGKNVVIPAHYHGSIVGVTLAFMGISYDLLPRLGFGQPLRRVATWQPYVYGAGQLLHILGLAWSGGYGVQRKTAGAAQGLERIEQIAGMAIMGLGGLIAIIGGLLFVIVAIHSIVNRQRQ